MLVFVRESDGVVKRERERERERERVQSKRTGEERRGEEAIDRILEGQ